MKELLYHALLLGGLGLGMLYLATGLSPAQLWRTLMGKPKAELSREYADLLN